MPTIPHSLDLFEKLLAGATIQPQELDYLIANQTQEDQHLEYKDGKELADLKKAAATVRQYVSGFANSTGGILILGISQNPWSISGCVAPGQARLTDWAASCLTGINSYLSPPPRIHEVAHPNGAVLVIVTARTPGLVPIVEAGQVAHYFRLHDETLKAPDYLVSDLVLGRRQHPDLHIRNFQLSAARAVELPMGTIHIQFSPRFQIENRSLLWPEHVQMGAISWMAAGSDYETDISSQLRSYIEVMEAGPYSDRVELVHVVGPLIRAMNPLGIENIEEWAEFIIPILPGHMPRVNYTWKAALYILPYRSLPIWYQISLKVNLSLVTILKKPTLLSLDGSSFLGLEPVLYERPIIAWGE